MNDIFAHRPPRSWIKVTITADDDFSDIIAGFLGDLTGSGVEQSMPQPGAAPGPSTVTGYLENGETTEERKATILRFVRDLTNAIPDVIFTEVIEEDWGKNWKQHFKPMRISRRITVKPTWEPYQAGADEIVLEIDPGLAFGTGLHASTRLALTLVEESFATARKPRSALDVGTGTGILAMAAARCGAVAVTAIDNDPDAVVCAQDNVTANGLTWAVTVSGAELADCAGPFDLVIANITSDVLILLAPQLSRLLAPHGSLVLAGILVGEQAEAIRQTFGALGLTLRQEPAEGEWQAFLFSA